MSLVIMLEGEHERFRALLDVVEREALELRQGRDVERTLLCQIFQYWSNYPERCHHPKEDLILAQMKRRHVAGVDQLQRDIARGHEELVTLGEALSKVLGPAGTAALTTEHADLLQQFVDVNRRHMALEEAQFFPLASARLDAEDWERIEFDLLDREDPVFDSVFEARYGIIVDAILGVASVRERQAKHDRAHELLRAGATRWLSTLNSVDDFNEIVGDTLFEGHHRLVGAADGGYRLECAGCVEVEIPPCTEQRAVWCAYFFLLGVSVTAGARPDGSAAESWAGVSSQFPPTV